MLATPHRGDAKWQGCSWAHTEAPEPRRRQVCPDLQDSSVWRAGRVQGGSRTVGPKARGRPAPQTRAPGQHARVLPWPLGLSSPTCSPGNTEPNARPLATLNTGCCAGHWTWCWPSILAVGDVCLCQLSSPWRQSTHTQSHEQPAPLIRSSHEGRGTVSIPTLPTLGIGESVWCSAPHPR